MPVTMPNKIMPTITHSLSHHMCADAYSCLHLFSLIQIILIKSPLSVLVPSIFPLLLEELPENKTAMYSAFLRLEDQTAPQSRQSYPARRLHRATRNRALQRTKPSRQAPVRNGATLALSRIRNGYVFAVLTLSLFAEAILWQPLSICRSGERV
ncbi:hypothetical protein Trydic_g8338 [Trypoxylus dichotomus]